MQLLDDLDDLVSAVGLGVERIRRMLLILAATTALLALLAGGMLLAVAHPPLALALAVILFTVLLYRSVTSPHGFETATD